MTNSKKNEKSKVDLSSLAGHGKAHTRLTDGVLNIGTMRSSTSIAFRFSDDKIKQHCVSLPNKYRLPFRIDMTIKHDYPPFWLLVGNGHISFGSLRDNHKLEDIAFPSGKPNQDGQTFDNRFPFGEWVDISITFHPDEMQVLISGEERFYSRKLPYMNKRKRSELDILNNSGFSIDFMISKLSTLSVKSIVITEFQEYAPIIRGSFEKGRCITKIESDKPSSRVF